MHRYSFLLIVIFILFPILMGCDAAVASKQIQDQNYLQVDRDRLTPEDVSIVEVIDPTASPTQAPLDEINFLRQSLLCESTFCQIQWAGWLSRPFNYPDRNWIDLTYPYASTGNGTLAIHHGVEFPNPYGTAVRAAADGRVVFSGTDDEKIFGSFKNFYGKLVIIEHPEKVDGTDLFSLYGHLSEISVDEGDMIREGDVIGRVGASGVAGGSHLHFEVRYGVNNYHHSTNPVLWFSPLENQQSGQTSTLAGLISGPDGKPLSELSITLEKTIGENEVEKHYYLQTYAQDGVNAHPVLEENFSMPDLPPGNYRLSFIFGTLYEIYFTLDQGMLGFINLQMK